MQIKTSDLIKGKTRQSFVFLTETDAFQNDINTVLFQTEEIITEEISV